MNNLDEMAKLSNKFKDLYWKGLTGIEIDRVQVKEDFFHEMFDNYNIKDRETSDDYPYELHTKYKDIIFFCLTKEVDKSENIKKESS